MKRIVYFFSVLILSVVISAYSLFQARTISGVITDVNDNSPLRGVMVKAQNSLQSTTSDEKGRYSITIPQGKTKLIFSYLGYKTQEETVGKGQSLDVKMQADNHALNEVVVVGYGTSYKKDMSAGSTYQVRGISAQAVLSHHQENTETYNGITENRFFPAKETPLSTFGIDVDAASYSNLRRFINNGQLPPADAVRIEEMVNYFSYSYPQPKNNDPFSVNTEISSAPWNNEHRLVRIGLQGKKIETGNLPACNLVFLIDVSGSMNSANKLPLVKSSLKMLVDQLREQDKVSIVVYAGAAGLVLPPTTGDKKQTIKDALNQLNAGGSTAGGEGIKLAYKTARENFIKKGNNRVILATDGDFNVGISGEAELKSLIEKERESDVFLTALGYGMGNYKDSKLETLADKGNGNYAYIDNSSEARKVLVNEFGGTLFTIAKDVKLQVEFNPAKVQAYRLIGYENRMLNKEDFNNDKKDAGDLGTGHTVTALYEIIPVGITDKFAETVDKLKYQKTEEKGLTYHGDELLTVKLRYKKPDGNTSALIEKPVIDQRTAWNQTSDDFRFAAAVAAFGMLLRNSDFKQSTTFNKVIAWSKAALGKDEEGYRNEFVNLVKSSALLSKELLTVVEE